MKTETNFQQYRRNFLKKSLFIPVTLTPFLCNTFDLNEAEASVKWWKVIGRATIIGRTLIITEVILGTLRAFDIDIAESVKTFVCGYMSNNFKRFATGFGSPLYERQISKPGQAKSGYCQVGEYGYTTQENTYNSPVIWTPAINMWAALGDEHKIIDKEDNKIDLKVTRCGFPKDPAKKRPPSEHNKFGGYTELTQNFEKGNTKIIIDHSMPEDIESIYLRNKNEQYWLLA